MKPQLFPALFCLALVASCPDLTAQTFSWVRLAASPDHANAVNAIAADGEGNAYVAGLLYGSVQFGSATVDKGGFLARYGADGTLEWATGMPDAEFRGVAADSRTNAVYVVGDSLWQFYVAGYDRQGNLRWSHRVPGSGTSATKGYGVAVDHQGNVYAAGMREGRAVVEKYSDEGDLQWSRVFVWSQSNGTTSLYWEARSLTFDNSGNLYALMGSNGLDMMLVKINPESGYILWERQGAGTAYPEAVVYDGLGHIVTGLTFTGTMQLEDESIRSVGDGYNGLLVQYDANGNLTAKRGLQGANAQLSDIASDRNGNIFICGEISSTLWIESQSFAVVEEGTGLRRGGFWGKLDEDLNAVGILPKVGGSAVASDGLSGYVAGETGANITEMGGVPLEPHGHSLFVAREGTSLSVPMQSGSGHGSVAELFPNPVSGTALLSSQAGAINHVEICDVTGRMVRRMEFAGKAQPQIPLDVEDLPPGVYYIHLHGPEGTSVVKALKQ